MLKGLIEYFRPTPPDFLFQVLAETPLDWEPVDVENMAADRREALVKLSHWGLVNLRLQFQLRPLNTPQKLTTRVSGHGLGWIRDAQHDTEALAGRYGVVGDYEQHQRLIAAQQTPAGRNAISLRELDSYSHRPPAKWIRETIEWDNPPQTQAIAVSSSSASIGDIHNHNYITIENVNESRPKEPEPSVKLVTYADLTKVTFKADSTLRKAAPVKVIQQRGGQLSEGKFNYDVVRSILVEASADYASLLPETYADFLVSLRARSV